MKPAMSAEKTKYAMSLQRSASAPETMVTEEDANATASRNRSIAPGAWSAPRSRKNCTQGNDGDRGGRKRDGEQKPLHRARRLVGAAQQEELHARKQGLMQCRSLLCCTETAPSRPAPGRRRAAGRTAPTDTRSKPKTIGFLGSLEAVPICAGCQTVPVPISAGANQCQTVPMPICAGCQTVPVLRQLGWKPCQSVLVAKQYRC